MEPKFEWDEEKEIQAFTLKEPHSLGVMSKSLDFFKVWILGRMNNIRSRAEEIINSEMIYI